MFLFDLIGTTTWVLQGHEPSFHNLVARSKSTLDSLDIMANNQNSYRINERDIYLQNHTAELYWG